MLAVPLAIPVVPVFAVVAVQLLLLTTAFGVAHADYGLCRPSPYVEVQAVELAADGLDKLIDNIC